MKIIKFIILLICFIITTKCYSQDSIKLKLIVVENNKRIPNCVLEITSNDGGLKEIKTNDRGVLYFDFKCSVKYEIKPIHNKYYGERAKIHEPCSLKRKKILLKVISNTIYH